MSTESEPTYFGGPVEVAARELVAALGELDARRSLIAVTVIRVAALIDDNEAGSAVSALARELRTLVATLELPAKQAAPSLAVEADPAREDGVARARDELAQKRRERAGA